ncbi:MAG: hypothetical protein QM817_02325 [Archangium sp.]
MMTLIATTAFAGNRAKPGGTLQVALVSPAAAVDPLTADAPVDALRLLLTHQLLCRVVEISHPNATTLRLTTPPSVDPKLVTEALQRVNGSTSPLKGLLATAGAWTVKDRTIDLTLKQSTPDLDRILCHPAFAIPLGNFKTKGAKLEAFEDQPTGRPHLDAVVLQTSDARTVERWFAQRRVHLVAGAATSEDVTQLFVTALVAGPGLGPLKTAVDSTVDRADLARFFVTAPAGPLHSLLPPSLGGITTATAPAKPAALAVPREVTLFFDEDALHERNIAQRLQVKLQPLGYRLALKPLPRAQLRSKVPGENELVLQSFVLPPSGTGALLMWLELSGQRTRIPAVVQQLAAASELDAKVKELTMQLTSELPIIPLVTRGLGVTASKDVQHLTRDVLGLPRLDDVSLSE